MALPTFGTVLIVLLILIVFGLGGWIVFTHLRARRLGLPTPTLSSYNPFGSREPAPYSGPRAAPGGIVGWVNDKMRMFKNRNNRVAGGAYEEPLSNVRGQRGANRGFGPLDPDDAWDARVGTEADAYGPGGYYEEQEVGLHGNTDTSYGGQTRGLTSTAGQPEPFIGGSKKGLDTRYDEEMHGGEESRGRQGRNPFDDDAEASNMSLRGVSPRPEGSSSLGVQGHKKSQESLDDSPTERRSMFHENV